MNVNDTSSLEDGEIAAAEREDDTGMDTYTQKFTMPLPYNGKNYDELTFDWSKLTGNDSIAIEDELQTLGKPVLVAAFSSQYLIRMASRACTEKIGSDAFLLLNIADYNKIRNAARSFLLKSGA